LVSRGRLAGVAGLPQVAIGGCPPAVVAAKLRARLQVDLFFQFFFC
jgi:hypothetical protein